jgi:hypothetical protein
LCTGFVWFGLEPMFGFCSINDWKLLNQLSYY